MRWFEVECKVWFLGGLKVFVGSGFKFEVGEGLEGSDFEVRKSFRFCVWDAFVDGVFLKVNFEFSLGLVGEESFVFWEDGRDFVGVVGVEEG